MVKYRRRREQKTNFKKRLSLLKSGLPRLVIRRSNRHVQVQLISYHEDGDRVMVAAHSSELLKYGWKYSMSNIPAAYLTGWLAGHKIKKILSEKNNEAVLDLGLQVAHPKGVLYSALKGVIDAGVKVPHSDEILPPQEWVEGYLLANWKKIDGLQEDVKNIKLQIQKRMEG